jgi:hypothetical protein
MKPNQRELRTYQRTFASISRFKKGMADLIRSKGLRESSVGWQVAMLALMLPSSCLPAPPQLPERSPVAVSFDGKFGQIEIGGPYVGAEFHHSLPLPNRVSFYFPVANSIDLSTDYWRRDESKPFAVVVSVDGKSDTVGRVPFTYSWTPYHAVFTQSDSTPKLEFSYRFCEDLPVMVWQIKIQNRDKKKQSFEIATSLSTSLRTCQSYTRKDRARVIYLDSGAIALTDFDEADTDSARVFVANAGEAPLDEIAVTNKTASSVDNYDYSPRVHFRYRKTLDPDSQLVIVQLIGSCRQRDGEDLQGRAVREWRRSIAAYEGRVEAYATRQSQFLIADTALAQTMRWSKAVLASNRHYINGRIVPMPCPAEYNFFFTHDMLLTDLGAVLFDLKRVREDLLFLHALAGADSALPHAYYWRDDGFKTEFCASDNWNHLWFIILAGSYLKHSGDRETLLQLYPLLEKSLALMLQNKGAHDLMYASRPDWWDIGKVYGARTYITTLMIRALRAFSAIALELNVPEEKLREHVRVAESMQGSLSKNLWDHEAGFLLNMLDSSKLDGHYYAGSLLAAAFDLLDERKRDILLEAARRELLDRGLGIRNAMPANFHRLIDVYGFNGMEAGEPYIYINGGVWSQGIAWYALGLLAAGKPDSARDALTRYLTLAGIGNSPGGQPALFEYRNADPGSPHYGRIDKPTFLWAAGWYLLTLHHLAGVRENEWNISFDPHLPNGFEDIVYDLQLNGKNCEVSGHGRGEYFKRILVDGKNVNSAVVLASPAKILLERGRPESPYLAYSSASVSRIEYNDTQHALTVQSAGVRGQSIALRIVSLSSPRRLLVDGVDQSRLLTRAQDGEVWTVTCRFMQTKPRTTLVFEF